MAPLFNSVPPVQNSAAERMISQITEGLISRGHEVTLFASGDSHTAARLVPIVPESTRNTSREVDSRIYECLQLQEVAKRAEEFDLIHFHTGVSHFAFSGLLDVPTVTTFHGSLENPDLQALFRNGGDYPVISKTFSQRDPLPYLNWVGNCYDGASENLFRLGAGGNKILIHGTIDKKYRFLEHAYALGLEVVVSAGLPDKDSERNKLFGQIGALVISHENAFAQTQVLIEAFACGTPVIIAGSSSHELIKPGSSGVCVYREAQTRDALTSVLKVKRAEIRESFEARFTIDRLVSRHLSIYEQLCRPHAEEVVDLLARVPSQRYRSSLV